MIKMNGIVYLYRYNVYILCINNNTSNEFNIRTLNITYKFMNTAIQAGVLHKVAILVATKFKCFSTGHRYIVFLL